MPPIYERIEELCRKKGINVTVLCSECSIPRTTLSEYKKGRQKTLSVETLGRIAAYFGVSVEYLCGKEENTAEEDRLKVALFGGDGEVTDEMWDEVKRFARFIKERENGNN